MCVWLRVCACVCVCTPVCGWEGGWERERAHSIRRVIAAKAPIVASRLFEPSRNSVPCERAQPPVPPDWRGAWRAHGREKARAERAHWPAVHAKCRYKPKEELSAWAAAKLNAHKLEPAADGAAAEGAGHERGPWEGARHSAAFLVACHSARPALNGGISVAFWAWPIPDSIRCVSLGSVAACARRAVARFLLSSAQPSQSR